LLIGFGCLAWRGRHWPLAVQAAGASMLLAVGVWWWRRLGLSLFGPVFRYDLVRTARRGQLNAHRSLYAVLLGVALFLVLWFWFPFYNFFTDLFTGSLSLSFHERTEFALSFYRAFMVVQFLIVCLVTPAYVGVAVAEEKTRRTLEFLLATDLSDREIVLGILGARLGNLLLLMLTGLPVLTLLQFLGGVDPEQLLLGFAMTVIGMVSLGTVSILISIHARSPLRAVLTSYVVAFAFLPCSLATTIGFDQVVAYFVLHATVITICGGLAISGLRASALAVANERVAVRPAAAVVQVERVKVSNPPAAGPRASLQPYPVGVPVAVELLPISGEPRLELPPVGRDALLWKEMYVEPGLRAVPPRVFGLWMLLVGFCLLLIFPVALSIWIAGESPGAQLNSLARGVGSALCCLMFFLMALSASGRVSRERERQTLEGLLTLPVDAEALLFAKWLGSVLGVGLLGVLVAAVWALGLLTGALNPFALPFLAAAWMVYAAFFSSLGLWFSVSSRSSVRATLFTLLAALVMVPGPGIFVRAVGGDLFYQSLSQEYSWATLLADFGLTPPATLWLLGFRGDDLFEAGGTLPWARIVAAVAGLHLYMAAAAILWLTALSRLRAEKGPPPRRPPRG
jgi:ABC-type transport system involved in multi-copper enzyme maturation permease subunit